MKKESKDQQHFKESLLEQYDRGYKDGFNSGIEFIIEIANIIKRKRIQEDAMLELERKINLQKDVLRDLENLKNLEKLE